MRDAPGRFLRGFDADRHQLTQAERRRGYRNAVTAPEPCGPCDNAHVLA
jgi:hypothetical protein